MAEVLLDARYFVGAADLSGQNNKIELDDTFEEKETTNWLSGGAKEVLAGIESVAISAEGQWEAGDPGKIDDLAQAIRRLLVPHTIGPRGADVSEVAYFVSALETNLKLLGAVGDVAPWSLTAAGSGTAVRGLFLHPPGTVVSGDGNGSAVQHVAVSAGQRLYGAAHCLSLTGTSVAVTVQSDTVSDFSGSPETRLTFDTFTTVGSDFQRTAVGAHADTWYRVQFDITAASALVVVAIGVA